jgi:ribosomal-protein-serine acetyltransferase
MLRHVINPALELRQLQPADAAELFALVDTHRVRLREWLPWVDAMAKPADSDKYIADTLRDFAASRAFSCGIRSLGRLVGVIGHNRIDWAHRVAFPYYWLAPDSEGRGIMTQCFRAVIDDAFTQLQVRQIVIAVATGNLRAQRLPAKLGFKQVSTLKKAEWLYDHHVDHYIYSLAAPASGAAQRA